MTVSQALVAVDDNSDVGSFLDNVSDVSAFLDNVYHSPSDTQGGSLPSRPSSIEAAAEPSDNNPIIPPTPAATNAELDPLILKDQRSHERARQRLKKPADIYKTKRRCHCRDCRQYRMGAFKAAARSILQGACSEGKDDLGSGHPTTCDEWDCPLLYDPAHIGASTTVPSDRSVSLLDLVKPQKKGSEKRFEVVDRPRQVLLLDDFTEIDPNMYDLDEWEHIESGSKQRRANPKRSYAMVAASRA